VSAERSQAQRAGPSQPQRFHSVTTYLSWDHDRLNALLVEVTAEVDAGRLEEARLAYRRWEQGFTRHLRIEEELLFPLFEARAGIVAGPTETMREEHREARRAVATMREGLGRRDVEVFREALQFLRSILPGHMSKEERLLYPATDGLLTEAQRQAVSERLQRE
jgi:iron-sulfur cluster repair protein YtfE (RIC family)